MGQYNFSGRQNPFCLQYWARTRVSNRTLEWWLWKVCRWRVRVFGCMEMRIPNTCLTSLMDPELSFMINTLANMRFPVPPLATDWISSWSREGILSRGSADAYCGDVGLPAGASIMWKRTCSSVAFCFISGFQHWVLYLQKTTQSSHTEFYFHFMFRLSGNQPRISHDTSCLWTYRSGFPVCLLFVASTGAILNNSDKTDKPIDLLRYCLSSHAVEIKV